MSTVDIDRVVDRQRRGARRRRTVGLGATAIVVVAALGGWLATVPGGLTPVPGVDRPATASPTPVFLGPDPQYSVAEEKVRLASVIDRLWTSAQLPVTVSPAEAGRDTFAVDHVETTGGDGQPAVFAYVARAMAVRDADHAGTLTLTVGRLSADTVIPRCGRDQPNCVQVPPDRDGTEVIAWQSVTWDGVHFTTRPGYEVFVLRDRGRYVLVSVTNADVDGLEVAPGPGLTRDQAVKLATSDLLTLP